MITHVGATNYRCFESLTVPTNDLVVVAGANGSGKTTLLDLPVLIGDLLRSRDVSEAFMDPLLSRGARASSLSELCFRHHGESFSLGIEAQLPEQVKDAVVALSTPALQRDPSRWPTHIRYELRLQATAHELTVQNEYLFLFTHSENYEARRLPIQGENAIQDDWRFVIRRAYGGESSFRPEGRGAKERATLIDQTLPAFPRLQFESEVEFPASRWFLDLLTEGVVFFDPTWSELRKPSQPALKRKPLLSSGENLPWLALRLHESAPERFESWVAHVRTALPQITAISVREREDDHHAYFRVRYEGGFEVSSSGLSEGTLRIMALTLIAYIDEVPRLLVVEEPENSIHPQAIDTIVQSLRSLYERQVWVSTHSPVVLATTEVLELLITSLARSGAASVVPGQEHRRLAHWKGAIDLGSLFATGVFE